MSYTRHVLFVYYQDVLWFKRLPRCTDGFYGRDCSIPCPKPFFGWNCQLNCTCSIEDCHHVYGCRRTPLECATGKYGDYCEFSCRYPNYGNRCQLACLCDEVFCDPSSGCAEATTEAEPKSTSIFHLDNMCAEEKKNVYESNSTSLIAGIISLLIVAGLLLVLYAMAYLHNFTCIVQGDTASESTL
ncbi:multiple epidermal growth factor-like domains protein 10 [Ostrea edulis]|uniref:multiple epidermal growth factor-like domains protein 10 n=1 Tax=Ostrea edulis TaxID=37623 RepID=UPI0024AEABCC|nr:multiple epidermal growth factor-like domains protein 10 [Ostrea edulis]